ncbi:hypothetical protein BpHYR1_004773 [Brachionus plicatilis]|uniref:Uncharacterized protein n=1 Tax=Brachionus plicatilis TaxID=10195 RepID=A0A3M7T072_BRAPC|nr:hypothetical protein BpHYR1_004773 [Brachionus plicatilis]
MPVAGVGGGLSGRGLRRRRERHPAQILTKHAQGHKFFVTAPFDHQTHAEVARSEPACHLFRTKRALYLILRVQVEPTLRFRMIHAHCHQFWITTLRGIIRQSQQVSLGLLHFSACTGRFSLSSVASFSFFSSLTGTNFPLSSKVILFCMSSELVCLSSSSSISHSGCGSHLSNVLFLLSLFLKLDHSLPFLHSFLLLLSLLRSVDEPEFTAPFSGSHASLSSGVKSLSSISSASEMDALLLQFSSAIALE